MNAYEKMRDALSDACYAMFNFLKTQYGGCEEMANALDKAKAALAEPRRNCDVGTIGEQEARFYKLCDQYNNPKGWCDIKCPLAEARKHGHICELIWANLPYSKEANNERKLSADEVLRR